MDFFQNKTDTRTRKILKYLILAVDIYLIGRIFFFFFTYLDSSLLFKNTVLTGGDSASWHALAHYLKNTLLPHWFISGWDPGNFCGYPLFQFYFSLPFLLASLLSLSLPLTAALKIVTLLGSIILPVAAYFAFKKMGYRFPLPIIAACFSLVFLFQGDYTMFGGNLKSTFAGEFCYSFSLMVFVFYLGSLYAGMIENKYLLINSLLLAFIGLTHSFVFLVALFLPLFFSFDKGRIISNLKYTIRLNILSLLLMGFWLLPFIITKKYMTPFYLIWIFNKRSEILFPSMFIFATLFISRALLTLGDNIFKDKASEGKQKILFKSGIFFLIILLCSFIWRFLWEDVSIITVIFFVLPLVIFFVKYYLGKRGIFLTSESTRSYRYLCFIALIGILLYFNAHFLNVPDIRFLPIVVLMIIFVSVDLLGYLLSFIHSLIAPRWNIDKTLKNFITFLILSTIAFGCAELTFKFIKDIGKDTRDWFKYNYAGYEAKPFWKDFKRINEHLRGDYSDSRVAYEKSPFYNRYGTDRVFESLPYFSGRSTLEGILFSSSFLAKPIMFFQTEFSKEILAPISYMFSRINTSILPTHFEMFNVSQIIAVSEEMKGELRKHPDFIEEFQQDKVSIFRYRGNLGYVSIPENYPIIYQGPEWKQTFYQWFKQLDTNDIPIVPKGFVERVSPGGVFSGKINSLSELSLQRKPILDIDNRQIRSKLKPLRIEFYTPYLGLPHIVKVSYFPNWKVKGAERIYPVAPGFMMVVPESHNVLLYYSRALFDWLGIILTLCGIILLLYCGIARKVPFGNLKFISSGKFLNVIFKNHRKIMCAFLVLVGLSTIYSFPVHDRPVKVYRRGVKLFSQGDYEKAIDVFKEIVENPSVDRIDRALCMLFSARSYTGLQNQKKAIELYQRIIKEYPNSRYVAESYYEIGQIYRYMGEDEKALEMFEKAITIDKYSAFAEYAQAVVKDMQE